MAPIAGAWYSGPMRGGRAAPAVALIVASLLGLRGAQAQVAVGAAPKPAAVALSLEYVTPGDCPSAGDFEARVKARTLQAEFAEGKAATVAVHVTVRSTGSSFAGHLFMVGHAGTMSTRDVEDTLCADVVDALALVTALAIDPNAMLSPSPGARAPTPAPTVPPPVMPPPVAPPPTASVAPPAPLPAPPEVRRPAVRLLWHLDVGIDGKVLGDVAPDAMLGGGAYVELESDGDTVVAPSARLSLFAATDDVFVSSKARFTLLAARADGCPVRLGAERLSIRPCAGVDVGDLFARGIAIPSPESAAKSWVAMGPLVRARWSPLGRRFFLDLDGAALFPLTRFNYVFQYQTIPTTTRQVHQAPAVLPAVSVGAGVRFP